MTGPAAVLRALALAALLVRAQTLSNGVDDYNGGRYTRLDRFLNERMGLAANRSAITLVPTVAGRGPSTRTTAAGVFAAPPDDVDNEDDEDDADDDDDVEENVATTDETDNDDEEPIAYKTVTVTNHRLRHSNGQMLKEANDLPYDRNFQKQEPARTMSPMSENKWKLLGSRKMVEETFRNPQRINLLKGDDEAYKHQMRVSKEASCKIPRPRVVKVADVYPSSNKRYIPSCTLLHVCAEDTGCCGSPSLKCGPKSTEPVHLQFLVYTAPGLGERQESQQSSKSLLFYNHTECECQMDDMPKDSVPTPREVEPVDPPLMHRINNNCKCPTEYSVRYLANGSCACDCFDKQHECIRYKKGNIYFNYLDRYCITSGQCMLPMCEYGVYLHRAGRCPKKYNTLDSFKKKHYF